MLLVWYTNTMIKIRGNGDDTLKLGMMMLWGFTNSCMCSWLKIVSSKRDHNMFYFEFVCGDIIFEILTGLKNESNMIKNESKMIETLIQHD